MLCYPVEDILCIPLHYARLLHQYGYAELARAFLDTAYAHRYRRCHTC